MGQKPSSLGGIRIAPSSTIADTKLPFPWIFRRGRRTTHTANPEQPIKFQYKTRRKRDNQPSEPIVGAPHDGGVTGKKGQNRATTSTKIINEDGDVKCTRVNVKLHAGTPGARTKSEPNLAAAERGREKHVRRKRKSSKVRNDWRRKGVQQFGYDIQDVDSFLTKATIEKPANIPVVLAFPSVLYQTRIGGYQAEISLPLGMVVNAVFKNQHWLYVQTPHAEEGYVSYAACLPLGIIPPPDDDTESAPCWEKSTDVFPKPSGNMTDTEKLSSKSDCGGGGEDRCRGGGNNRRLYRNAASTCGERSVDRLYLRAAATAKRNKTGVLRQTLLVINSNYFGAEANALHVRQGDVVFLLRTHVRGWFWVRNKNGDEGFIPAVVAGHGFL